MRDSAVIEAFSNMEKLVGHDIRMLNKTVATLAIRQDAFQKVLFGGRFSLLWAFILNIFAPKMLERAIGTMHMVLDAKYQEQLREAAVNAKKQVLKPGEVTNPKAIEKATIALAVGMLMLITVGCVPMSKVKQAHDLGYAEANLECIKIQSQIKDAIYGLQIQNALKTERLRRFNQVDENGNLRNGEDEKKPSK